MVFVYPKGHFSYKYIMILTKAYKLRLYPTKSQQVFFNKTMGACRVIYNEMLYKILNDYTNNKKCYNSLEKYNIFKDIKSKYEWMSECDSQGLTQTRLDLEKAFNNFFNHYTKKPKFKKKKEKNTYRNSNFNKCKLKNFIKNHYIKIPKIGLVKFRQDYNFSELHITKIYNITIERSKSNKYYCSICVDVEQDEYEHNGEVIGIDLGIKDLVIDSNGNKYSNPKYQVKTEKKIKHLQRLYSKKIKGSKNQEKARLKLAIAHEKLCNKRKDYLHKLTTKLIKENDVICIENLNVKGMTQNNKLAKAIQDASFGTLVRMLAYKAQWHNRQIVEIGRFYPSSKICHCCGYRMQYMGLEIRNWTCPNCDTPNDRDVNAAINIKNEGLRLLDLVGHELPDFKLLENPTMDECSVMNLKSSGSMKKENNN